MARKALDDKHLKSDPFQDLLFQAIDYVYMRRRRFIIAAALLLSVVGLAAGTFAYSKMLQGQTTEAFNAAEQVYHDRTLSREDRLNQSSETFRMFVSEHSGSTLTPYAWAYIAAIGLEKGNPEQADEAYQKVIAHETASESLRAIAQAGLAMIRENQNRLEESGQLYRTLPQARYGDLTAYSLGRIAVSRNDMDEARQLFESIDQNFPDSPLARWAREALSYYP